MWKRIVASLLMVVAVALFGWLAVARRSGASLTVDLAVRNRVHESASPAMTVLARVLATVGSPGFVSVLFVIVVVLFHGLHWRRAALTLAEVMGLAVICNTGLKRLIHCARPQPFFGTNPSSYSFPSGHALYSLCFYGALADGLAMHASGLGARLGIFVAAGLLVAGIGFSRVYLGVHYPTDVVAGHLAAAFILGLVFVFLPG